MGDRYMKQVATALADRPNRMSRPQKQFVDSCPTRLNVIQVSK